MGKTKDQRSQPDLANAELGKSADNAADELMAERTLGKRKGSCSVHFGDCIFTPWATICVMGRAMEIHRGLNDHYRIVRNALAKQLSHSAAAPLIQWELPELDWWKPGSAPVPAISATDLLIISGAELFPLDMETRTALQQLLTDDPSWIIDPVIQLAFYLTVQENRYSDTIMEVLANNPQHVQCYSSLLTCLNKAFSPHHLGKKRRIPYPDSFLFAIVHYVSGILKAISKDLSLTKTLAGSVIIDYAGIRARLTSLFSPEFHRAPEATTLIAIDQVAFMLQVSLHPSASVRPPADFPGPMNWTISPRAIRDRLARLPLRQKRGEQGFLATVAAIELMAMTELPSLAERSGLLRSLSALAREKRDSSGRLRPAPDQEMTTPWVRRR